jgi:pyocin large subunit-like protein
MKNNDKDWGKIIFRIVIVLFIIFFISRWFKLGDSDRDPVQDQTPSIVITENESDVGTEETADTEETVDEPDTGAAEEETADEPDTEETVDEPEIITAEEETADEPDTGTAEEEPIRYEFRNRNLLDKHYDKHGIEMGFASAEEYEAAASAVVTDPRALHKLEEEDGDDVFYLEDTREFVVVSTDGFIRTYYYASKDYFDRQ